MCMLYHALRLHFVHQSDHIRSFFCHMAKWTIFGMNFARLHTAYAGFWKRQTTSFLDLRDFAGFWRIFALFCGIFAGKPWRFFGPKWFLHMLWWFSRQFWVTRCKNYDSPLSPPKDSIENGSGSLTLDHLDQDQTTPMEYKSNRSPLCIQVADWRAVVKSPIVLFQAGGTQRFLLYHKYM